MQDDTIALFELNLDGDEVSIVQERHYKLVGSNDISDKDLQTYKKEKR
jgi:hypothetical protein